uniref:Uncharacterized protein n=1 Tax=Arundo donax TaxID=35708 RepID=A0A0A8ZTL7_ARUDO
MQFFYADTLLVFSKKKSHDENCVYCENLKALA